MTHRLDADLPPASATGVVVVVVNHDGGDLTMRCLESVSNSARPRGGVRVVLVDNASSDGVAERVRQELPEVEVIASPVNRGFAGGCNLGIVRRHPGEHVALLNNDAVAEPGWIVALVDALDERADLGAACPKILLEREPRVIDNAGTVLVRGTTGVDRGHGQPDGPAYAEPSDVFAWCGAAVLLRSSYLDAVGVFDERLFLYSEDLDLAWRGRLAGWRYVYCPSSVVVHAHAATTSRRPEILRYYTLRNHLVVGTRYGAPTAAARAVGRAIGALLVHALRDWRTPEGRAALQTRARALGGFARMLPGIIRERRTRARAARPELSASRAAAS